jgi:hypothetical protein
MCQTSSLSINFIVHLNYSFVNNYKTESSSFKKKLKMRLLCVYILNIKDFSFISAILSREWWTIKIIVVNMIKFKSPILGVYCYCSVGACNILVEATKFELSWKRLVRKHFFAKTPFA